MPAAFSTILASAQYPELLYSHWVPGGNFVAVCWAISSNTPASLICGISCQGFPAYVCLHLATCKANWSGVYS